MKILTQKEEIVLKTLKEWLKKKGKMPTVREIQAGVKKYAVEIKSVGSVFNYLKSLEEKGYIKKTKADRGIEIIEQAKKNFINIPILGTANAGCPLFFAEQNIEGFLKISRKLFTQQITEHIFAIEVSGSSMNLSDVRGKRIEDGDYVLIDAAYKDFRNGDKVLATIDGLATIKTFMRIDEDNVGLFPQSTESQHRPIYLTGEDNFVINGKIIDVMKNPKAMRVEAMSVA